MACSPQDLIASVSAFSGMNEADLELVAIALLARWLKSIDPGADVSSEALLESVARFSSMNQADAQLVSISLLCQISQS
jgi:hypothetical protein